MSGNKHHKFSPKYVWKSGQIVLFCSSFLVEYKTAKFQSSMYAVVPVNPQFAKVVAVVNYYALQLRSARYGLKEYKSHVEWSQPS